MKYTNVLTSILVAVLGAALLPLGAQGDQPGDFSAPPIEREIIKKKVTDPLRGCTGREKQPAVEEGELILYATTWGNNPREGEYRKEMERLLRIEVSNVRRSLQDVAQKHKELVLLYPEFANYQEIVIEDVPGTYRDGVYVNSKKLIIFHYNEEKALDCVVLDSMTRSIYGANEYTRKLIRLYYPNIQTMELETRRHNYVEKGTLERTSPEIQLRALRLVFLNLRTALYSMV